MRGFIRSGMGILACASVLVAGLQGGCSSGSSASNDDLGTDAAGAESASAGASAGVQPHGGVPSDGGAPSGGGSSAGAHAGADEGGATSQSDGGHGGAGLCAQPQIMLVVSRAG